jgi:hypothetical protein
VTDRIYMSVAIAAAMAMGTTTNSPQGYRSLERGPEREPDPTAEPYPTGRVKDWKTQEYRRPGKRPRRRKKS